MPARGLLGHGLEPGGRAPAPGGGGRAPAGPWEVGARGGARKYSWRAL